jgi:hypothetical protein
MIARIGYRKHQSSILFIKSLHTGLSVSPYVSLSLWYGCYTTVTSYMGQNQPTSISQGTRKFLSVFTKANYLTSCFFKTQFNVILPPSAMSPKWETAKFPYKCATISPSFIRRTVCSPSSCFLIAFKTCMSLIYIIMGYLVKSLRV